MPDKKESDIKPEEKQDEQAISDLEPNDDEAVRGGQGFRFVGMGG